MGKLCSSGSVEFLLLSRNHCKNIFCVALCPLNYLLFYYLFSKIIDIIILFERRCCHINFSNSQNFYTRHHALKYLQEIRSYRNKRCCHFVLHLCGIESGNIAFQAILKKSLHKLPIVLPSAHKTLNCFLFSFRLRLLPLSAYSRSPVVTSKFESKQSFNTYVILNFL